MFDIRYIRDNPEAFDAGLAKRGLGPQAAAIIAIDERRRAHLTKLQDAQARRNAASKEIGKAMAAKDTDKAEQLKAEVAELKAFVQRGEEEERRLDAELQAALSVIPNLPLDDVPVGEDETANVEIRRVGEPASLPFDAKEHFEVGEQLGQMDFEAAARMSGARFVVLKGQLARLERALASFMLDIHTSEFGYTEVVPPLLVRDQALFGTAQLPKFAEDLFFASSSGLTIEADQELRKSEAYADAIRHISQQIKKTGIPKLPDVLLEALKSQLPPDRDVADFEAGILATSLFLSHQGFDAFSKCLEYAKVLATRHWLIPTAEVPLTNLVREQILDGADLPLRYTAWTPCFRSEAGSAGRDVRGIIRQHQFSKVELVSITTPEQSLDEHERMTACAEEILKRLGLAYRVMLLCTGDMGFASRKTYDIEVWLPGQKAYREISSCSVCGDFQARRMSARYRVPGGKEVKFVHTLNGSGLAVGRTMVAILETFQQADGSVVIPEILQPYMGGARTIELHGG